jgi:hypothetical protein
MSRQNAGQVNIVKMSNKFFENMERFIYLGTARNHNHKKLRADKFGECSSAFSSKYFAFSPAIKGRRRRHHQHHRGLDVSIRSFPL